jgi:hypothetical protein
MRYLTAAHFDLSYQLFCFVARDACLGDRSSRWTNNLLIEWAWTAKYRPFWSGLGHRPGSIVARANCLYRIDKDACGAVQTHEQAAWATTVFEILPVFTASDRCV